jgi:hypothetical protein
MMDHDVDQIEPNFHFHFCLEQLDVPLLDSEWELQLPTYDVVLYMKPNDLHLYTKKEI